MRIIKWILLVSVFMIYSCGGAKKTTEDFSKNMNEYKIKDTLSYAWGIVQANEMKQQQVAQLNMDDFLHAFDKEMNNTDAAMEKEVAYEIVQKSLEEKANKMSDMVKENSEKFLAENGSREEVTVLPSGLQYEILTVGNGPMPTASQKVTTHYTGSLIDGTIFDSSVQRGEPITFPVGGVIQGWQEALQLMPKGSKWKLYIPQDLAYGSRGAGGTIPPYSALIFEIELIEIE